eukprot:457315-Rhodomonas_salina.1
MRRANPVNGAPVDVVGAWVSMDWERLCEPLFEPCDTQKNSFRYTAGPVFLGAVFVSCPGCRHERWIFSLNVIGTGGGDFGPVGSYSIGAFRNTKTPSRTPNQIVVGIPCADRTV